jgi:protease-4
MGRRLTVLGTALAVYLAVGLLLLMAVSSLGAGRDTGGALFGPRVAVVELDGIILDVDELVRDLKSHRENPLVRAVVVRINSPGGVVAPTQELYGALHQLRQAGKPVVASLGAVAASGGYYVAVAADQIFANPGTLTGSIGVIMQLPNFESLMKKVGVEYVVIKAGQFKDIGNVARPMSPEERRVLQTLLEDVHGQFISAVADGRKLSRDEVARFADGRVFSGQQAKTLKMVDTLGGLDEAINAAAGLAGLPVPPRTLAPRRRMSVYDLFKNWLGLPPAAALVPGLPVLKTPLYLMD